MKGVSGIKAGGRVRWWCCRRRCSVVVVVLIVVFVEIITAVALGVIWAGVIFAFDLRAAIDATFGGRIQKRIFVV